MDLCMKIVHISSQVVKYRGCWNIWKMNKRTTFIAACYGQPQYSTMTEGKKNQ